MASSITPDSATEIEICFWNISVRSATISDLKFTVNSMSVDQGFLPELISNTEFQFERIINLLR